MTIVGDLFTIFNDFGRDLGMILGCFEWFLRDLDFGRFLEEFCSILGHK